MAGTGIVPLLEASWLTAMSRQELTDAVHDDLRNLRVVSGATQWSWFFFCLEQTCADS